MKQAIGVFVMVMIMAVAVAAVAADATKCTASTQDCLNYMARNLKDRGWVGIETDDSGGVDRMVVTRVIEGSPAEKAGFQVGDTLVAVNGVSFTEANQKQLKDVKHGMKPGADITYTVARKGSRIDLKVELGHLPDDVMAQWIGGHMLEHAEPQVASTE